MILQYLCQIGKAIEQDISNELEILQEVQPNLDKKIYKYITENYKNIDDISNYFKIKVRVKQFVKRIKKFKDKLEEKDLDTIIGKKLIGKKMDDKERLQIFLNLVEKVDPNLISDLKKSSVKIDISDFDLNNYDNIKLLLGNQTGTKTYFSPVMYSDIKSNRVPKFPLWKINLSVSDEKYKCFFDLFPSVMDYGRISEFESNEIIQVFISEIFLKILNDWLSDKNIDNDKYYFLFVFGNDEKFFYDYPFEDDCFLEYYKSEIKESGKKGICEICGKKKTVIDGPKSDIGFYTDDQNGFVPIFLKKPYKICNNCNSYLIWFF